MATDELAANVQADRLSDQFWATHDVDAWCQLFHSRRSRYIDPIFGEYRGRVAIRRWLVETMRRAGRWRSRNVGARLFDGYLAAGEAELVIPLDDAEIVLPFAWVQRYEEGFIVYRRDYYDTHELRSRVAPRALIRPEFRT